MQVFWLLAFLFDASTRFQQVAGQAMAVASETKVFRALNIDVVVASFTRDDCNMFGCRWLLVAVCSFLVSQILTSFHIEQLVWCQPDHGLLCWFRFQPNIQEIQITRLPLLQAPACLPLTLSCEGVAQGCHPAIVVYSFLLRLVWCPGSSPKWLEAWDMTVESSLEGGSICQRLLISRCDTGLLRWREPDGLWLGARHLSLKQV